MVGNHVDRKDIYLHPSVCSDLNHLRPFSSVNVVSVEIIIIIQRRDVYSISHRSYIFDFLHWQHVI